MHAAILFVSRSLRRAEVSGGQSSFRTIHARQRVSSRGRGVWLHLPFPILLDEHLTLASAMRLPTFETSGLTLLKRLTLVIDGGLIKHVFYPAFSCPIKPRARS